MPQAACFQILSCFFHDDRNRVKPVTIYKSSEVVIAAKIEFEKPCLATPAS